MFHCSTAFHSVIGFVLTPLLAAPPTTPDASAPGAQVATGIVGAGYAHSMIVDLGRLFVCGWNGDGQLGLGDHVSRSTFTELVLPGSASVVQITGGARHTLAVTSGGTAWAWGSDAHQQLGNGDVYGSESVPYHVNYRAGDGELLTFGDVKKMAAGNDHSIAVRNDGTVWGWGSNAYGQTGAGASYTVVDAATQVPGLSNVIDVAAGYYHSAALTASGQVYCWGRNLEGQLGSAAAPAMFSHVPVLVGGSIGTITKLTAGSYFTGGLDTSKRIWAWGWGYFGQLGTTDHMNSPIPLIVNDHSSLSPTQLSAGGGHFLGIFSSTSVEPVVMGWGLHTSGQTGHFDHPEWQHLPRQIDHEFGNVDRFTSIAAGGSHGVAHREGGFYFTWGENQFGQLGHGTNTDTDFMRVAYPPEGF